MINKNVNLEKKVFPKEILVLIILFLFVGMNAQLNSEIGYTATYIPMSKTNKIIKEYNTDNNILTEMKKLNFSGGFHVGLTYRIGALKLGGYWEGLNAKRSGIKGDFAKNTAIEKKLFFYFNSFSGNLEVFFNYVGIGAAIDKNFFNLKTNINGTSSKVSLMKSQYYSTKLYLSFYLKGSDKLGLEFMPFIRLPWQKNSMSDMASFLEVPENEMYEREDFIQYGITILLLNGLQPDQ